MSFKIADAWVDVSFDTSRGDQQLQRAFASKRETVPVDADTTRGLQQIEQFVRDADGRLRDSRGRFVAKADTAPADTALAATSGRLALLNGSTANVNVDANVGGALAKLGSVAAALGGLSAAALAGVGSVAGLGAALGAGMGATAVALTGVSDAVDAIGQASDGSAASAEKLAEAMGGLTPAGRAFAVFLRGFIDGPLKGLQDAAQANLLPGLQSGLQALTPIMKPLTQSFGEFSGLVGQALGGLIPILGKLAVPFLDFATAALQGLAPLGPVLDQFATAFGGMVAQVTSSGVLQQAMGGIAQVIGSVLGYLPGLIEIGLQLMAVLGPPLAQAIGALLPAVVALAQAFGPVLAQAIGALVPALNWFAQAVTAHPQLVGALTVGALALGTAFSALSGILPVLTGALGAVSLPVLAVTAGVGALVAGFLAAYQRSEAFRTALASLGQHLVAAGQQVIAAVMPALQSLWQTIDTQVIPALAEFGTAVAPLISWLVDRLAPVVATVFAGIVRVIDGAMKILSGLLRVATGVITGDWSKAWDGIKQIAAGAWEAIKAIVNAAWAVIKTTFQVSVAALQAVWGGLWNAVKSATSAAWSWITGAVTSGIRSAVNAVSSVGAGIVGWFRALPGSIVGALGNLGGLLVAAGRRLIQGLISGIRDAFGDLRSTLGEVTSLIPDWKGPAARDANLLRPVGRMIMGGLQAGIADRTPAVEWQLGSLTDRLARIPAQRAAGQTAATAPGPVSTAPAVTEVHHHTHYAIAAGAFAVDVSKLRSIDDLVTAISALKPTARQYGVR